MVCVIMNSYHSLASILYEANQGYIEGIINPMRMTPFNKSARLYYSRWCIRNLSTGVTYDIPLEERTRLGNRGTLESIMVCC